MISHIKGRYTNKNVTHETFEQIKDMVRREVLLDDMVIDVMQLIRVKSHYAAYRWITKAAVAVKNDLNLEEINQHYKILGKKPTGLASELKEALQ